MAFKDSVVEALGPLWPIMEPYKVHEGKSERGIPTTHDVLGKFNLNFWKSQNLNWKLFL